MAKFKLLTGRHTVKDNKHYGPGDIIESDIDLVKFGGEAKFRRVSEKSKVSTPKAATQAPKAETATEEPAEDDVEAVEVDATERDEQPDFDAMTVPELKKYAADNAFDITGANTKAKLVEALKAAALDVGSND